MKFFVFYAGFSLYFLCFVSTAPEPTPLLNPLLCPSNSIVSRLSPLSDIVSCLIIEAFSIVISALCVTYNIVINLSQFLECIIAHVPVLGHILARVIKEMEICARATNAACRPTFEIYGEYMNTTCVGVLPALSSVTFALQDLALMTPKDVECSCDDSRSFPSIGCLLLQVIYLYASIGCVLPAPELVELLTHLIKKLPKPLGTVLGILTDGLYYGLWHGLKTTCETTLNVWSSELKKICPVFVINPKDILKSILNIKLS